MTDEIQMCQFCGNPPGQKVGPPAMARCIMDGCPGKELAAVTLAEWNAVKSCAAQSHDGLRHRIATITIDDEGHRNSELQQVLVAGYVALKWALPLQAADETLTAIVAALGTAQSTGLDQQLVRSALEFYADPFAWKKKHDPEDVLRVPDFYSETSFGDTALEAIAALGTAGAVEADPVAWRWRIKDAKGPSADWSIMSDGSKPNFPHGLQHEIEPLYAAPSPAALDPATVEAMRKALKEIEQLGEKPATGKCAIRMGNIAHSALIEAGAVPSTVRVSDFQQRLDASTSPEQAINSVRRERETLANRDKPNHQPDGFINDYD